MVPLPRSVYSSHPDLAYAHNGSVGKKEPIKIRSLGSVLFVIRIGMIRLGSSNGRHYFYPTAPGGW